MYAPVWALSVVLPAVVLLAAAPLLATAGTVPLLHHGLHFEPLRKTLASSVQLVLVNFNIGVPSWYNSRTLTTFLQEKLSEESSSRLNRTIADTIDDLNKLHELLEFHSSVARNATKRATTLRRSRRGLNPLHIVSDFSRAFFGFATTDDITILEKRDEEVLQHMVAKYAIIFEATQQQSEAIQTLAKEVNKRVPILAKEIHKQSIVNGQVDLAMAMLNTLAIHKLHYTEKLRSIEEACRSSRIPSSVVHQADLELIVDEVNLVNPGQRVAVEPGRPDTLYKLEIAACLRSAGAPDEMLLAIKVPLVPRVDGGWRALAVTPLSFLYQGRVCQLLPRPVVAVMASATAGERATSRVRLLEGEDREACLTRNICNMPRINYAANAACVAAVYAQTPLEDLRVACNFTCQSYSRLQITHVSETRYSVVNMERELKVLCPEEEEHRVPPKTLGALLIDVPCNCSLEDADGAVLVERQEPCADTFAKAVNWTLLVPTLWAAPDYDEMVARMGEEGDLAEAAFVSSRWNVTEPPAYEVQAAGPAVSGDLEQLYRDVVAALPWWAPLAWYLAVPALLLWLLRQQCVLRLSPPTDSPSDMTFSSRESLLDK